MAFTDYQLTDLFFFFDASFGFRVGLEYGGLEPPRAVLTG